MRLPRVAVTAALVAAVTVPAVSATAAAYAGPAPRPAAAKSHGKHGKPVRHVFAAAGSIVAVDNDGATITVAATVEGAVRDIRWLLDVLSAIFIRQRGMGPRLRRDDTEFADSFFKQPRTFPRLDLARVFAIQSSLCLQRAQGRPGAGGTRNTVCNG